MVTIIHLLGEAEKDTESFKIEEVTNEIKKPIETYYHITPQLQEHDFTKE